MLFKKIKGIRVNEDEDFGIYSIDFDRTFDRKRVTLRLSKRVYLFILSSGFIPSWTRLEFISYEFNDSLVYL